MRVASLDSSSSQRPLRAPLRAFGSVSRVLVPQRPCKALQTILEGALSVKRRSIVCITHIVPGGPQGSKLDQKRSLIGGENSYRSARRNANRNIAADQPGPITWARMFEKLLEARGVKRGRGGDRRSEEEKSTRTVRVIAEEAGVSEDTAFRRRKLARDLEPYPEIAEEVDACPLQCKYSLWGNLLGCGALRYFVGKIDSRCFRGAAYKFGMTCHPSISRIPQKPGKTSRTAKCWEILGYCACYESQQLATYPRNQCDNAGEFRARGGPHRTNRESFAVPLTELATVGFRESLLSDIVSSPVVLVV